MSEWQVAVFDHVLKCNFICLTDLLGTIPKRVGFSNPKPMKVTVYITVDPWSDTMPFNMPSIRSRISKRYTWPLFINKCHTKGHSVVPLVLKQRQCYLTISPNRQDTARDRLDLNNNLLSNETAQRNTRTSLKKISINLFPLFENTITNTTQDIHSQSV